MPPPSTGRLAALTLACLLAAGGAVVLAPGASALAAVSSEPTSSQATGAVERRSADALVGGESLAQGESLTSPSGEYSFLMQTDGNAVVYRAGGGATWSTATQGRGDHLDMQTDGNAVIYSAGGQAVWSTVTSGDAGALLALEDDGDLVVRRADGSVAWSSSAGQAPPAVTDTLTGGSDLRGGQQLVSTDGGSRAAMQTDGNFVVYSGGSARWSAVTSGAGNRLAMQGDGNAVVYANVGAPLWSSVTSGNPGARMVMQDDGNLVIYSGGRAIWASTAPAPAPAPAPQSGDVLPAGSDLRRGQQLVSSDGKSRAAMQNDGNFVVYTGARVRWSAGTAGAGDRLAMQGDGNAVVYSASGRALWQTGTDGRPGARMVMQNDGNLVVYSSSGALWSSNPGDVVDCDSFRSQAEAQEWFDRYRGYDDPGRLDGDNDGRACQAHRY
ncbi:excalibur calcium-binding domain-containing protein [Rathayibacter sp. VKM Ac-2760]|uniref:excalibur calcium-binding domain-containing protein n=1 Tax=Rathayibacter sp. VKM Ac-2760 TaxID=2609253 RepID=UPI001316CA30|nr:excalibur calcium-binding domain-containing protein [Rathayibacter sp. VKM Ac-2760]QHC58347.1 hypothetical protein GSU72_07155 [Rathayibacter sp. VKM Ac-2760]